MDFHTPNGWLDVHFRRGGLHNIDEPPARVVLEPGHVAYFVSYWNDVDTDAGPCKEFDRAKVTSPTISSRSCWPSQAASTRTPSESGQS
jgi:hypothetical protein